MGAAAARALAGLQTQHVLLRGSLRDGHMRDLYPPRFSPHACLPAVVLAWCHVMLQRVTCCCCITT